MDEFQEGFEIKPGKGVWFWGEKVTTADPESFEVIADSSDYGRDQKNVYYGSARLKKVDLASFEVIGRAYAKDCSRIYWHAIENKKADYKSFRLLEEVNAHLEPDSNDEWACDKNHLYNANGRSVISIDGKSFSILNHVYGLDRKNAYCFSEALEGREHVLSGVSSDSFTVLSVNIASDEKAYYYEATRFSKTLLKKKGCSNEDEMLSFVENYRKQVEE